MDLRQLEVFLEVSEQLHFGRAAERLYLGQPTVSETVRRLERELGGQLFERSTRQVRLTRLGEEFAPLARAAYDAVADAYDRGRAFARDEAGRFVVGHTGDDPTLVDAVVRFQREVPGVTVSLHARSTGRLLEDLQAGRLHVLLGWDPVPTDGVDVIELERHPMVAVLPAAHPAARRGHISPSELAAEPLVGWPRPSNPVAYDRFAATMDATGRPWTLIGTAIGRQDLVARVLSGFGIGVGYGQMAADDDFPGVVTVPVADDGLHVTRTLAWRRQETHPALRPFVALLRERRPDASIATTGTATGTPTDA